MTSGMNGGKPGLRAGDRVVMVLPTGRVPGVLVRAAVARRWMVHAEGEQFPRLCPAEKIEVAS